MPSSNQIAAVAAAMGDAARINILMALRHDGILSATELAGVANVAPSTTSEHLARLLDCGLVRRQCAGRQRLYSLADGGVCDIVDGLAALAGRQGATATSRAELPQGLLHSRLCLDHLGGELGCLVADALFDSGRVRHGNRGPELTPDGVRWLARLGIDHPLRNQGLRCPLRLCHDWTQDAWHLGGGIAGAMLSAFRRHDWLRVRRGQVEVEVTPKGVLAMKTEFGLDLRHAGP